MPHRLWHTGKVEFPTPCRHCMYAETINFLTPSGCYMHTSTFKWKLAQDIPTSLDITYAVKMEVETGRDINSTTPAGLHAHRQDSFPHTETSTWKLAQNMKSPIPSGHDMPAQKIKLPPPLDITFKMFTEIWLPKHVVSKICFWKNRLWNTVATTFRIMVPKSFWSIAKTLLPEHSFWSKCWSHKPILAISNH